MLRFLIIDDDPDDAFLINEYIEDGLGLDDDALIVEHTPRSDDGVEALGGKDYDLLILDYRLGAGDGLELLKEIRGRGFDIPVLLLTGQGDEELAVKALKAGATDYLRKSKLSPELLASSIRLALELHAADKQRKEANSALLREKEFTAAILQNSYDGIAALNPNTGEWTFFSPGMERLLGYNERDIPTIMDWFELAALDEESHARMLEHWEKDSSTDEPVERIFPFRHKNGEHRWRRFQTSRMPGGDVIINGQDITESQRAKEKIQHLALHDQLTDLPTRRLFHDRLIHALEQAKRQKTPLALLYVDLDKFKEINDTHGHDAGDAVLIEIAHRLRFGLRASDTVARVGGDEFVIILPELPLREHAVHVAEKIIENLTKPIELAGFSVSVGASVGVAFYPDHGDAHDNLVNNADRAMYDAKNIGGNKCCVAALPSEPPCGGRSKK